jgi:hypothetical protein
LPGERHGRAELPCLPFFTNLWSTVSGKILTKWHPPWYSGSKRRKIIGTGVNIDTLYRSNSHYFVTLYICVKFW